MNEVILSLEKKAMERWRNGDPLGWAEISAEDVIYVEPGLAEPIVGIEEYGTYLGRATGKVRYQVSEFIAPRIDIIDDAAILTYNYMSAARTPEGSTTDRIYWNATEIYFLIHGHWKIVHTHWSYVGQKPPERVEIPIPILLSGIEYDGVMGDLMTLESAAMERWRKGDPWGFIEIYAPDATYFDTGTARRIDGLAALTNELAPRQGKIFYDVMDFIDPKILVRGNTAVLFYRFMDTVLKPDGSIGRRKPWNCTEVYIKTDTGWRILHTHWSFVKGERRENASAGNVR